MVDYVEWSPRVIHLEKIWDRVPFPLNTLHIRSEILHLKIQIIYSPQAAKLIESVYSRGNVCTYACVGRNVVQARAYEWIWSRNSYKFNDVHLILHFTKIIDTMWFLAALNKKILKNQFIIVKSRVKATALKRSEFWLFELIAKLRFYWFSSDFNCTGIIFYLPLKSPLSSLQVGRLDDPEPSLICRVYE